MPDLGAKLKELLHNKYAVAGLIGAVGLGGFVLYQRKKTTGSTSTDSTTSAGNSGGVIMPGSVDTSGTDIANYLGNYSGQLQNQLDAFAAQQTDFLNKIGSTSGSTSPTTNPFPGSPKPTASVTHQVTAGETWSSILGKYFSHSGTASTNAAALEKWDQLHGGSGSATLTAGQIVHLPNASPGFA